MLRELLKEVVDAAEPGHLLRDTDWLARVRAALTTPDEGQLKAIRLVRRLLVKEDDISIDNDNDKIAVITVEANGEQQGYWVPVHMWVDAEEL